MHIKENDNLNITVHDGKMVLEKAEKPKYLSFRERVEAFYGKPFEQVCLEREQLGEKVEEIDTGAPVHKCKSALLILFNIFSSVCKHLSVLIFQ